MSPDTSLLVVPRQRARPALPLVPLARTVARTAHFGERDLFGEDLFTGTLTRIVRRVRLTEPRVQAAAWLHLTVDRTDYTLDTLRAARIPADVVALVEILTPRQGEGIIEQAIRVADDPDARIVAMAAATDHIVRLRAPADDDDVSATLARVRQQTHSQVRDILARAELEDRR